MSYEIAPDPADTLLTLGLRFRLVDIREDHECARYPIVSDYRIPFSRFDPSQIDMPRDAKLLVVCEKGQRSRTTTALLREKGWSNAFSLSGGLNGLLQNAAQSRAA